MAVTVPVVDNFNRASIGSSWSATPYGDSAVALAITGSTVINGSGYASSWYNAEHLRIDQYGWTTEIACDVPTLPGTDTLGGAITLVLGPGASSADGYEFDFVKDGSNTEFTIYRFTNGGSLVSLATGSSTLTAGDTVWVRRDDDGVFTFGKVSGGVETTVATSSADTTYTGSMFAGLAVFDTTIRLDNFRMGQLNLTGVARSPYMAAASISANGTSGTTLAVTLPTHITDDILVVQGWKNGAADLSMSGWTQIIAPQNSANMSSGWWWKRATSDSETATLTSSTAASSSDGLYGQGFRIRGCVTSGDPFEDATVNGSPTSSSTPTWATFDTTGDDELGVLLSVHDDDPGASSGYPPSGWAAPANASSGTTVGGDARGLGSWRRFTSATTVTGGTTWTMAGASYWRVLGLAFLPASAGGTTNDDTGNAAAGSTAAAADVHEAAETATATAGTTASGGDVHEASEAASAIAGSAASGVDVHEASESGAPTSAATATGADVHEAAETATATAGAVASGSRAVDYARSGSAVAGSNVSAADAAEFVEAGSAATAAGAGGSDVADHSETGTATTSPTASGESATDATSTYDKAGSATTGAVATAVDSADYAEAATATAGPAVTGVDSVDRQETGTATTGAAVTGPDSADRQKTGAATAGATTAAAKTAEYQETGGASAGATASAEDAADHTEQGTATTGGIASAAKQYTPDGGTYHDKTGTAALGAAAFGAVTVYDFHTYPPAGTATYGAGTAWTYPDAGPATYPDTGDWTYEGTAPASFTYAGRS